MKIIKPSHEILKTNADPLLTIETAGRLCYKSEANITPESAEKFVRNLTQRQHYAMLEHATVYFIMDDAAYRMLCEAFDGKDVDRYIRMSPAVGSTPALVSGNVRAWYELLLSFSEEGWAIIDAIANRLKLRMPAVFGDLSTTRDFTLVYDISEEELLDRFAHRPDIIRHHRRISVKFICDRGVTHEFVRHRDASFAQESTRYCTYSKGQFGGEITVIEPLFFELGSPRYASWKRSCETAEKEYMELLSLGAQAQEARSVLPNSLKAELLITATEEEWQHICNLRAKGTTGAPHPQMKEIMYPAYQVLVRYTDGRIE